MSDTNSFSMIGWMAARPWSPNPSTLPVPVSWTRATDVLGISSLCRATYWRDPCSPSSSPVNNTNRTVRFGFTPARAKSRAVSRTTQLPVPLSVVPWPRSHESRWAPTTTNSSAFSPGISPTVL